MRLIQILETSPNCAASFQRITLRSAISQDTVKTSTVVRAATMAGISTTTVGTSVEIADTKAIKVTNTIDTRVTRETTTMK